MCNMFLLLESEFKWQLDYEAPSQPLNYFQTLFIFWMILLPITVLSGLYWI